MFGRMFSFLDMVDNYEQRKVARWEDEKRMVDTAEVNDGAKRYETAFQHPEYNNNETVIVEAYDTKDEAMAGHAKWLKVMLEGPLPDTLIDCGNSEVSSLLDAFGGEMSFKRSSQK